jgi:DNA repair exonuclease SbcCD ATPase subunit
MTMTKTFQLVVLSLLASLGHFAAVHAQTAPAPTNPPTIGEKAETKQDNKQISALGVRQQQVERMMEELEAKFQNLAQTLQKTEPDRAAKLIAALQESRKLGIEQRMARIVGMLDTARLDTATDEQKLVVDDLKKLIELLLDEASDKDRALDEAERLQKWKEEIKKLIAEQQLQKRESEKIAKKDDTLNGLDAQIAELKNLIAKEQKVIEATEAARKEGVQKFGSVADEQAKVREATQKLKDQLAKEGKEAKSAETKAANSPDGENQAGDAKPADGQSKEGEKKDGSGKASERKEGAGKGSESKDGKPGQSGEGEASSGEKSGGESKPGEEESDKPPEAGEAPLKKAIENQRKAEDELQEGKGKAASKSEEAALEEMKNALAELTQERNRIASLPKEAFQKMADKQEKTTAKTDKLLEEMQKAPAGKGEEGGAEGGKKPGQNRVANAQKSMQGASGDLRKEDPAEAARRQRDAVKELEQALKEIEEKLAQLREETQVERLARLEARFREMLTRQQKVTVETVAMNKRRDQNGELKRADRLALAKLSAEELAISEEAQKALVIILDDGTSVVFPEIVEQLRDDLRQTGKWLGEARTDELATGLQDEIETTLKELIEALEKARQPKPPNPGGQGGGGGGQPPLLPNSAELKLLRASQLRINRRTETVGKVAGAGKTLDNAQIGELKTLSDRQRQIGEMTDRILNRE